MNNQLTQDEKALVEVAKDAASFIAPIIGGSAAPVISLAISFVIDAGIATCEMLREKAREMHIGQWPPLGSQPGDTILVAFFTSAKYFKQPYNESEVRSDLPKFSAVFIALGRVHSLLEVERDYLWVKNRTTLTLSLLVSSKDQNGYKRLIENLDRLQNHVQGKERLNTFMVKLANLGKDVLIQKNLIGLIIEAIS